MLRTATTAAGGAKLAAYTPLRAMSAEQLTAFWEAVEGDTSLQEKLSASTDGEIDTPIEAAAVVAIAKDAGFTITAGDLLRADAQAILELNDDELQKMAGGGRSFKPCASVLKYGDWLKYECGNAKSIS